MSRPSREPISTSLIAMKRRQQSFITSRYQDQTRTGQSLNAAARALVDMQGLAMALDQFVAAEEARTRVTDVDHWAYSTAARAARVRSSNLKKSLVALRTKLNGLTQTQTQTQNSHTCPPQMTQQYCREELIAMGECPDIATRAAEHTATS
jgi:hypothetical protein